MGISIDTKTNLKNISGTDKFNGLALVLMENHAWYVFDEASTTAADDDNIILPNDSVGRWFKCNNTSNILNTVQVITVNTSTTTIDVSNADVFNIVFNQNTTLNFNSNPLRNGQITLYLDRNSGGYTISGWDSRIVWNGSPYSFGSGVNTVALSFIIIGNIVYFMGYKEY